MIKFAKFRTASVVALAILFNATAMTATEAANRVEFVARDIAGVDHPSAAKNTKATVWVFIAHDCPVCNSYAPELARICADYTPRGVSINLVYAESDLTPVALATHAREHSYASTLFGDAQRRIAQACGITVTPEVAVISPDHKLVYRGRIDNRYVRIGRERAEVTSHDLRATLDAILAGKPVPAARTQAVGCYVAPAS